MTDVLLSILHHTAIYVLVSLLVAEWVLLRGAPDSRTLARLARADLAYGLAALVLIGVGVCRVIYGAKGSAFYTQNPIFWLKMGLFAGVGLVSIVPTVRLIQWGRRHRANASALPSASDFAALRRYLLIEAVLFAGIPICAALMARGYGLG